MDTFKSRLRIVLLGTSLLMIASPVLANPPENFPGIPARLAVDYIHAAIEAGRHTYSEYTVDRLFRNHGLQATEHWERDNTLLLPAEFLKLSSQFSNKRGIGMRYRLVSLWPINPENSPQSIKETRGLEEVIRKPSQPFTWVVQTNGLWFYQAVYPDLAVTQSCVTCHNAHPKSPKTDFKLGDVMGGIVINLPLGRRYQKNARSKITLPPEVVTDYVHSILESNRTVYSRQIVNRLETRGMLKTQEHWKKEKALMLPAQFLMRSSEFIRNKKIGLDFQLISLWPINPGHGPANEFERVGLETVEYHPIRPYIGRTRIGRQHFFQAIYPDLAVTESCVVCHNKHPNSPKRNFSLHDVMGGIVVTLPLNRTKAKLR